MPKCILLLRIARAVHYLVIELLFRSERSLLTMAVINGLPFPRWEHYFWKN